MDEEETKSNEKEKWQLVITSVNNGYIIEPCEEPISVIQENEKDELKAHEELLYTVMEYFNFQGSKHDAERLKIVREKQK